MTSAQIAEACERVEAEMTSEGSENGAVARAGSRASEPRRACSCRPAGVEGPRPQSAHTR
jgi:hypothetical protein